MSKEPLVSIIIVNWNGLKWLATCLDSLSAQTYPNYEIILVDNASTDKSPKFIADNYPEIILVKNTVNSGFAGGNNLGLKYAKGELVLLLNNDTCVEADYLEKFVQAFETVPNLGAAQSKMINMFHPDQIDSCGSYWSRLTYLYHFGQQKDPSLAKYNEPVPVFSNKGASMLIRKDLIDKLGLFDDDFWCYYEETDFCHRVWLAGYECWYWPKATMYHAEGGSSLNHNNAYIQYHNFKNKLLSFLKNFEVRTLIYVLPVFIIMSSGLSLMWLLKGKFGHFRAFYQAIWWNVIHFKETIQKRKIVQSLRVQTDHSVFKTTKKEPRLQYYFAEFTGKGIQTYLD